MKQYYMPTKIISGRNCVVANSHVFKAYGNKAMIVTGRYSAKVNGSYDDVIQALAQEKIEYCLYDKVMSNPTVACAYEGAMMAKDEAVDFIIAIGGGSPIDAAKAMALIATNEVIEADLFKGTCKNEAMPLIAVPTTAGTGSEATQYAILTNDLLETKSGLANGSIFPKVSFLDASYMMTLPLEITINTSIDALSHAVEGLISIKSSPVSEALATKSIEAIVGVLPALLEAKQQDHIGGLDFEIREVLLYASMIAGMVIAQTGTTAVHAMGYSLTYFKDIDHGRANGLLMGHYLKSIEDKAPNTVHKILAPMHMKCADELIALMDSFFDDKEVVTIEELEMYSGKAIVTGNINNCGVKPTKEDLLDIYKAALNV